MADNVAITAGAGTTIGTDDVGGVQIQRVKATWGPDGTANDADVATGKPLPVQLRSPTGTDLVGTAGTGSAAVLTVQGNASGTALPVTGTITAVTAISNALPAGTNNIGDVDVLSVVPGTGATALGKAIDTAAGATDTGVAALAVRDDALTTLTPVDGDFVPLRTTSTGALWVSSADTNANGQAIAANSTPVVQASDRQNSIVFDVTLSTDTAAYDTDDLIADTQQLDAFFNKTDGRGVINSITIIDEEAAGVKFYVLFHTASTSMGSENSDPNISDANASSTIQGIVTVESTDWITISGTKIACIRNIGLPVKVGPGTDDLYVSVVNATGSPDWDADSLKLRIGALLD